ncbi:MAG: hypothetical protein EA414_11570 [Arthrospira sp. PLM2.Bin9]|nr:MAG: hypothetical protein EA414_11570 [Arthrospira sp. PLM2.Bin9]
MGIKKKQHLSCTVYSATLILHQEILQKIRYLGLDYHLLPWCKPSGDSLRKSKIICLQIQA